MRTTRLAFSSAGARKIWVEVPKLPQSPRGKLPPCCARKQSQLTFDQGNLRSAARRLARRPGSVELQELVMAARQQLATAKENFALHIHDDSLEHG